MTGPVLVFIGVSTGGSLINRVFPRWAALLGIEGAVLRGIDLPVGVDEATLRPAIAGLAADPAIRGALVTTHKIAVLAMAGDLLAALDPWARRLGEVSAIVRRPDGSLAGFAKDPITAGRALDAIAGPGWWRNRPRAGALLLGAGGAGLALAAALLERPAADRPAAIAITDIAEDRLAHCRAHLAGLPGADQVRLLPVVGAADHDRLLADLPPGSLVANGTGLGKDRPGSPLTDAARFPEGGIAWELNYRGALGFLRQAEAQAAARRLTLADGFRYFVLGWSAVIEEVFGLRLDAAADGALLAAAAAARAEA
jgi:shikimate 5-dehydrogenase